MKYRLFAVLLIFSIMATGCSTVKAYITPKTEEEIQESIQAEIAEDIEQDSDYQKYQELKNSNQLSEDNIYQDDDYLAEKSANADKEGKIHVTFAQNPHLDIQYYYDENLTDQMTDECYLEPGATIYASEPVPTNTDILTYMFDTFRISEYDVKGNRIKSDPVKYTDAHIVYKLPDNNSVAELSIEPIGKFTKRKFLLKATLADGKSSISGGEWYVNDICQKGDAFEVDPSQSCSVKYQFPENQYYCIEEKCSPKIQFIDKDQVVFEQLSTSDTAEGFVVTLDEKIPGEIEISDANISYSIEINGEKQTLSLTNGKAAIGFKPQDHVVITVDSGYMVSPNNIEPDSVNKNGKNTVYTFTIPDADPTAESISFIIKKQNQKEIEFKTSGSFLDNWFVKAQNDLVTVSFGDSTYHFNDLKGFIKSKMISVMEGDQLTVRVNDSIRINPNIQFRISLNGENDLYFNKFSETLEVSRDCESLNKVEIYLEEGYAFELSEIQKSNQDVKAHYYVDGIEIKEGQFLPKGTKVQVSITELPADYIVSGGAVKKGQTEGTVRIQGDTKSSDFVVKCEKQ